MLNGMSGKCSEDYQKMLYKHLVLRYLLCSARVVACRQTKFGLPLFCGAWCSLLLLLLSAPVIHGFIKDWSQLKRGYFKRLP